MIVKPEELRERIRESEFVVITSRSSGPGGQNVNKVSTKVEIRLLIKGSPYFSDREQDLIMNRLKNRINVNGTFIISSQSERSQIRNKEKAISKLFNLLSQALTEDSERRPTKPTKISARKRLEEKRNRGKIKQIRRISEIGEDE